MTDDLEKAWSDALDSPEAEKARAEALEVWAALTDALTQVAEEDARELARLSLDNTISVKLPLDDQGLADLLSEADALRRYKRLAVAKFYAVQALVEALVALKEKSATTMDLYRRPLRSWWEAGAFDLIRTRAELVARISRADAAAMSEIRGGAAPADLNTWQQGMIEIYLVHWRIGERLIREGYPDSALPHLIVMARAMVATWVGAPEDQLPTHLSEVFARVEKTKGMAPALQLAERLSEKLSAGRPPDIGISVPLAPELLRRLVQLLGSPPVQDFKAALGSGK
jgi:hypothetical protein